MINQRYNPEKHHRRSIRLKQYDYSQPGAYFVTICTQDRAHLFGEVVDGEMRLNDAGRMVVEVWESLPKRFETVELDAFVVMPNHTHGIIVIVVWAPLVGAQTAGASPVDTQTVGASLVDAPIEGHDDVGAQTRATTRATTRVAPTLGDIVGAFKSITTVEYIRGVKRYGWTPFRGRLWQRNYYEHIIRNERALDAIRRYIVHNPLRWHLDRYNAERVAPDSWAEEIWRMMREPSRR